MANPFSRTTRALSVDGFGGSLLTLGVAGALAAAWSAWLLLGEVTVYETTENARLEVSRTAHPVESEVEGRVVASQLVLDREVKAGDTLLELDATLPRLQRDERRTRLAAIDPQLEALHAEADALDQSLRDEESTSRAALDQARAHLREAAAGARFSGEESRRLGRLEAGAQIPELDLLRARTAAEKDEAARQASQGEIRRLEADLRSRGSQGRVRREQTRREIARLEGERSALTAEISRLDEEIARHVVRAPVSGRLGEAGRLPVGTVVARGDRLGAIVPPGDLQIVAGFPPPSALGRIRPGQPAILRLDGFPWAQYGTLPATVTTVASEARNGQIEVHLEPRPLASSAIPFQHGLTGSLEVEVEHLSPARLALRAAGQRLAAPVVSTRSAEQPRPPGQRP